MGPQVLGQSRAQGGWGRWRNTAGPPHHLPAWVSLQEATCPGPCWWREVHSGLLPTGGCDSAPSHEHPGREAAPLPSPAGPGQWDRPLGGLCTMAPAAHPPLTQSCWSQTVWLQRAVVLWTKSQFISGIGWGRRVGVGRGPRPCLRFSGWPGRLAPEAPRPHQGNLPLIINLVDDARRP